MKQNSGLPYMLGATVLVMVAVTCACAGGERYGALAVIPCLGGIIILIVGLVSGKVTFLSRQ